MNTRRFLSIATVLAVTAAGCSDDSAQPTPTTAGSSTTLDGGSGSSDPGSSDPGSSDPGTSIAGPSGPVAVGLVKFTSCDDVLSYIKSEALERVGPYGLGGDPYYRNFEEGMMVEDSMSDGTMADSASDSSSESASATVPASGSGADGDRLGIDEGLTSETGTNVQEAGIDEPDIIKTDGKRIITLATTDEGSTLTVTDISNRTPAVTGTLNLGGYAQDMVLSGDRIFVFTSASGEIIMPLDSADAEASFAPNDQITDWAAITLIAEISIADAPTLVNTMSIEGNLLSSRSVGNRLRVAVSSPPVSLPWVYPQTPAGEDRAEESNRQIIEESTLEDWLPDMAIGNADGTQLLGCDSIHHPAVFAGFDAVSIVDLDLDGGLAAPVGAVGVLAAGSTIYSSLDRFYVASTDWNPDWIPVADSSVSSSSASDAAGATTAVPDFIDVTTDLHAFAISATEPTTYIGSGEVPGSLLNQFAMDSYEGNLRVLTTSTTADGDTETFLRILAEDGDRLTEIGSVGGLGKGEQLYSARLFDEIGFAVTFEQIDPLYVLDLADPTNPKVAGELKIPGVSTYLHPIGNGRILGVGAAATDRGRRTGLKVSLFDVSDPATPQEIANWSLDGAGSESEYDAHAFHYSDGLLVLPLTEQEWSEGGIKPEAVVLRVDDTITEVGRISIPIDEETPTSDCQTIDPTNISFGGENLAEAFGAQHIQLCRPDDKGGWGSGYCESWTTDDIASFFGTEAADAAGAFGMTDADRIELCYPGGDIWLNQVRRVLNVNDTFYTMTGLKLQANDRATLDELGSVSITG